MKDKIINYFNHYIQNFKQRPLAASFILIFQIFFLWAWSVYFYFLIEDFITIVIPGRTDSKDNIYLYTFENVVPLLIGAYIFYRALPLMFTTEKNFKKHATAYALSLTAFVLWFAITTLTYPIFFEICKENPVAFWATPGTTPL